jgi:hypothetical protein
MKATSLTALPPLDESEGDEQLRLPLEDLATPPQQARPITTVHALDVSDRRRRPYELVVHQDPVTRCVLAYCLRYRPSH